MILRRLGLWWQRLKTRRKMERVFGRGLDPFGYDSSPYERARLQAMEAALGGKSYSMALEIGCAEGAFTEKLRASAACVVAVDVSTAALERARARLGNSSVSWILTDIRDFTPPEQARYDLIVLGDVLYYLDKPLVRELFEEIFARIAGWLAPSARLLLAHGFAGEDEKAHRRGFRERFEKLGLVLVEEREVSGGGAAAGVSCLISVLEKPS